MAVEDLLLERRKTLLRNLVLLWFCLVSTHSLSHTKSENGETKEFSEELENLRLEHRDHTYSDINSYRTLNMSLKLTVEMQAVRSVYGYVDTTFVKLKPSWQMSKFGRAGSDLVLDIRPYVFVTDVENLDTGEKLIFAKKCDDTIEVSVLECALLIKDPVDYVGDFKLRIQYSVSDRTSALHFIPPHQTEEGQDFFLVSTTQPSNTRGWIPCQDTPALKFPYRSEITVEKPFTVLMSGSIISKTVEETEDGSWETVQFKQDIPVPPYLIAITVADIIAVDVREHEESAVTDEAAVPSIKVWGERSVMEKLRVTPGRIFSMIPDMMDICERRYGRYVWGTYDVILAPPGYSFEGMEFPQMNYVSVSLIDFDKTSGPNYIYATWLAHEMIHSWFGDLVTPKYASDAWLSEGITQYAVSGVLEEYYGDPKIGAYLRHWRYSYLKNTLDFYTADKKILTPYIYNQHPFSGFSTISYNKGALFLEYIATHTGRPQLGVALRKYLDLYKYQSVDAADFVHVLYEEFGFESDRDIEREIFVWLERPHAEVPEEMLQSEIFGECTDIYRAMTRSKKQREERWVLADIAEVYKYGTGPLATSTPHLRSQIILVLEGINKAVSNVNMMSESRIKHWKRLIHRLDKLFSFTSKADSDPETFATWAQIAVKFDHNATVSKLPDFLEKQGRIGLMFSVLYSPKDAKLPTIYAEILKTKYNVSRYPGHIGEKFLKYVRWKYPNYQP